MKTFLTFFLGLFLAAQVNAICLSPGIVVFPESKMIKQNPVFLIEGYALSQPIIHKLHKKYPIYLQAERHKVRLNIQEVNRGMFRISQALLVPEEKLMAGKTYYLYIENLRIFLSENLAHLISWNARDFLNEPIAWSVESGTDLIAPLMSQPPILVNTEYILLGCGPAVYANFKIDIEDESECIVKTELFDLNTKKSSVYFLQREEDGKLQVGHGMCSGAFEFEKDHRYQARFSAMDMSGQTTGKWTDWIAFDNPLIELDHLLATWMK